jgi:hypothetical protein
MGRSSFNGRNAVEGRNQAGQQLGWGQRVWSAATGTFKLVTTAIPISKAASLVSNVVYRSIDSMGVRYVGIANNLARRAAEHLATKGIHIEKLLGNLSRVEAKAVEQVLIEIHGLGKNGGTLLNKINSISKSNPEYANFLKMGEDLLQSIGYGSN